MVRMRFPAQALEELRKDDPDTPVTLNLIRTLARRIRRVDERAGA